MLPRHFLTIVVVALAGWLGSAAVANGQATKADGPSFVEPPVASAEEAAATDRWMQAADIDRWTEPGQIESSIKTIGLLTIVSLAPALLLMTTSFVRISIVLGLLRQAIGAQLLPSNQIITSLAMFLTFLVMTPVWQQVYREAIQPYAEQTSPMTPTEAWQAGIRPIRQFMSRQIELAENGQDVLLFYEYLPATSQAPQSYEDVPLQILMPAFMLSELKTAFLIGFQIYLPFLILDLVVSSVTVSMGMMMLPPAMVSLPLKLLLFVLVDGWHLVVGMLLQSFSGIT